MLVPGPPRWRARDQAQGVQGVRPDAVAVAAAIGQAPGDESDGFITPISPITMVYRFIGDISTEVGEHNSN